VHNNLWPNKYTCKSVQIIQHYKKSLLLKFIITDIKGAIETKKTNIILTNKREKNKNVIIASIVILQTNLKLWIKTKIKINDSIASLSLLLYLWKCNL
jgi:membrane protein CcdC involved in cytochrome C biogenesis